MPKYVILKYLVGEVKVQANIRPGNKYFMRKETKRKREERKPKPRRGEKRAGVNKAKRLHNLKSQDRA